MIAPRRFLPSVSSLLALEAVDRLGSATAAAADLSLTHSAVSRQLKSLEEQLGVTLLQREGKGLALTPAGIEYAASARDYLQGMARASLKTRAAGSRSSLNLAVLPGFATHWLLPRMRDFCASHPGINVNFTTRQSAVDFAREHLDAAIHFGTRDRQELEYLELLPEAVLPVAAPALLPPGPVSPATLLSIPLLHLQSRPGAWEEWFALNGLEVTQLRGMLFDQFAQLAEAAAQGLGAALLPGFMAEVEIARGRLVPLAPAPTPVDASYFLVWPGLRPPTSALRSFLSWIAGARPQAE